MLIRKYKPKFALSMDKPVRIFSTVVLAVIIVGIVLKNLEMLKSNIKVIGSITLALNVITMLLGYFSSRIFNLNLRQRITISIESGIQNGTLAINIAFLVVQIVKDSGVTDPKIIEKYEQLAIPGGIYSLLMFFTGGFMMLYFGNRKVKAEV